MSEPVSSLAPFVERALTEPEVVEALGPDGSSTPEPRADGGRTGWGAARSAVERLD